MGGDLTEGMELLLLAWSEVGRGVTGWSRLWEEEEKVANERERLEGEERESWWQLDGQLVVVLASYGGAGGGWNGGEREGEKTAGMRPEGLVFG